MSAELIETHRGQIITGGNEFNITEGLGGISVQQGSGISPKVRIDEDGIKIYSAGGVLITEISADGFNYFNGAGTKIASVGANGFGWYDSTGQQRISIGSDSSGRVKILIYDGNGNPLIIVGQDPSDGEPIVAVVPSGENVEDELRA